MRGGNATTNVKMPKSFEHNPLPNNPPSAVNSGLQVKYSQQNQANTLLAGGSSRATSRTRNRGRAGGSRSSILARSRKQTRNRGRAGGSTRNRGRAGGSTRGRAGGSTRGRAGGSRKQSGGACVGGNISNPDGYGYFPPNNCMQVPTLRDPTAQLIAMKSTSIHATSLANAENDNKI